ncbi:DUF2188 domain-containing protein [Cytophagaceae bacterium DM2B3-1]|uniref:DUF2188 domain-containing protein n=1 Tax=Xanthocytophaga flava TaxID=3048013 RepID=A0ABT7CR77_9BACT|nr:DUF2188 domain-containing protein [Xanthocytophaga flavus]MDJ1470908.1 DUF2188 domain-containing protein [Xanthocytophaga flavus]MDJ1496011.1 DUF2188 domain-containing protein [Xanthocytophaga flavus]
MPWSKTNYPVSMKNLPVKVRNKAVEIANALLEDRHMEEGIAIATAISRAKDWAVNHDIDIKSKAKDSKITDVKKHGEDRYVIPYENNKWAVKKEGEDKVEQVVTTKQEAIQIGKEEARKNNASLTIQGKNGKVQKRISYNPNNQSSQA